MHHYFQSITNTKGDALTGYYVQVTDPNNGGAVVTMYADVSLTPILSVSGIANKAQVDSDGDVNFYVAMGTYDIHIYAPDAVTQLKTITSVAMNSDVNAASANFTTSGSILSSGTGGVGYSTGAGGAVTQATSKATGVTLNKACGQITLNASSLAANAVASFTFTNSAIAATDILRINSSGAATPGAYLIQAEALAAGSCVISIRNLTAGALAEALVLNFIVLKGVAA